MKLSVGILTYNQEKYIRQCLDSVLMQKVDFDYEIVVGDDASTDGTQDILRDYAKHYPGKFVLLLGEKNEGISMNYKKVLTACKGEYVALCEGDDYWTDMTKLQKQVDFLENHPDYLDIILNVLLIKSQIFLIHSNLYLPYGIAQE